LPLQAGHIIMTTGNLSSLSAYLVFASPFSSTIENGTLVVFKSPLDGYQTHRISGSLDTTQGTYYMTKGDANSQVDSFLIPEKSVIGPVTTIIPTIGLFFMIPREIFLAAALIATGLYIALTFYFWRRDEPEPAAAGAGTAARAAQINGHKLKLAFTALLVVAMVLAGVRAVLRLPLAGISGVGRVRFPRCTNGGPAAGNSWYEHHIRGRDAGQR